MLQRIHESAFDAGEWVRQLRRGTLELCVLALISQRSHYGYDLIATLGKWERLAVTEGTLYPMLRRLEKAGFIQGAWQESDSGPPRKYYHLTAEGKRLLSAMSSEWVGLTRAIDDVQHHREGTKRDATGD